MGGYKWIQIVKSNTVCVHFYTKRKNNADPAVMIKNTQIPVVTETKFLGAFFYHKMTFIPHIKYLKLKCQKKF